MMPRGGLSIVTAIAVAFLMLFSMTPSSVLAGPDLGSTTSSPVEIDCSSSTQGSRTRFDANSVEGATWLDGIDLKDEASAENEASSDLDIDPLAGASYVGGSKSSEPEVNSRMPCSLDSQSTSSEALPEQYVIQGYPNDDLKMVGQVPYYYQGTSPTCGQHAALDVIHWYGYPEVTIQDLYNYAGDGGTYQDELEDTLAHFMGPSTWSTRGGFDDAAAAIDWVKQTISSQIPVIAGILAFKDNGSNANHYVTIVGYDSVGWYIHNPATNQYDAHYTYDAFEEHWDKTLWSSDGSRVQRGVIAAHPNSGDGKLAKADVYLVGGGIPDVYDNVEVPYTVEVGLLNTGEDMGSSCLLNVTVTNAEIVQVRTSENFGDSWIALDSSGPCGQHLPASRVSLWYEGPGYLPMGDPDLHVTLSLMPTTPPSRYGAPTLAHVNAYGWIRDEDDRVREGLVFVDDDSWRATASINGQSVEGVWMTDYRLQRSDDYLIASYCILDDDVDPPTVNSLVVNADGLYGDTLFDCSDGGIGLQVYASDPSGIYSVEIMYGFSLGNNNSGWLLTTYYGPGGYYYISIPHAEWLNHVGEYLWWSVHLQDADYDMDDPADMARVVVPSNDTPRTYIKDDDTSGPTFSSPTPSLDYDSDSGSFRIWMEVSDPSGVSLVRMRYQFIDSEISDWVEATTRDGLLYSTSIPPEIWGIHAGHYPEYIYWQVEAWDADNDWGRINDSSYAFRAKPYSNLFSAPPTLLVVAQSPVSPLVTDPDGLRIGYDPVVGLVDEIPGAGYSGTMTVPQYIAMPYPITGMYRIDAFGTGYGPFTITIKSYGPSGALLGSLVWTGTAQNGTPNTRHVLLGGDGTLSFVDLLPPSTSTTLNGTVGLNGWFVSAVCVKLTAVDELSGVSTTKYRVDGGAWLDYLGPFTEMNPGVHVVGFYSVDDVGNVEGLKSTTFKIDTILPTITPTISGTKGTNGWYISSECVTLVCIDSTSGIASTFYQIDGTGWHTYNSSLEYSNEGIHLLEYYATDIAGNSASVRSVQLKIDTSDPTLYIAVSGHDGANGWQIADSAFVNLTAADSASGVLSVFCSIDGGSYQMYTGVIKVTKEGTTTLECYATDVAGRTSGHTVASFKLDKSDPVTGANVIGEEGLQQWYISSSVSIKLDAQDSGSGVNWIKYRVDGGTVQTYSRYIVVTADGTHVVEYYSQDYSGRIEVAHSVQFKIDSTKPSLTIDLANETKFTSDSIDVLWSSGDSTSGVATTEWCLDGGSWQTCAGASAGMTRLRDGAHRLELRVTDHAGNSVTESVNFTVDTNVLSMSGPYGLWPDFGLIIVALGVVITMVLMLARRRR